MDIYPRQKMRIRMIDQQKKLIGNCCRFSILILILFVGLLWASGGYDHGTSTGKGKLQIDLTWNPFNYFEYGQSYVVFGYGITNKIDLHGYFANHGNYQNGVNSYYYGIFYQYFDSKYLDLATAFGKRKMMNLDYSHFFFPQLLYRIIPNKIFSIGGSIVKVRDSRLPIFYYNKNDWLAVNINLLIPITKFLPEIDYIEDIKFALGIFKTGMKSDGGSTEIMFNYSIDILFKKLF